jgi:thermostable 8-oxoguanine DNA glycosylase
MNPEEIAATAKLDEAIAAVISHENSSSTEVYNIEVTTSEETTEISDIHRGTVDNPFLFDAKVAELEKFILVNMFVAGKNASVQQAKLDQFVNCVRRDLGEHIVDTLGVLSAIHNSLTNDEVNDKVLGWLKEVKAGQYSRLTNGIVQLAEHIGAGKIDLKNCNRAQLIKIKGIGYKTASMFLMYTRRNGSPVACLDTHILKYLREETQTPNVPLTTPVVKADYLRLEDAFLAIVRTTGKSVAEFDFEIWSRYRQKVNTSDSVPVQESTVVITEPVSTGAVEALF